MAKLFCWRGAEAVPIFRICHEARKSRGIFRYKKSNNPVCVVIGAITKEEAAEAVFDDSIYYQTNFGNIDEVKDEIIKDLHIWDEPLPH